MLRNTPAGSVFDQRMCARDEKDDNKATRCRGYTDQRRGRRATIKTAGAERLYRSRAHRRRRRVTIKRADAEDVQIKGPQGEEEGDNKESKCRGHTDQEPAEGGEG